MSVAPTDVPVLPAMGREDESLFARDENDLLVRRERETRERFQELVTITIDGYAIEVPRAVPKTDAQGNALRDADGELIPRTTTIHDAAARLVAARLWPEGDLKTRIPTLCHQPHMPPIGVCRMCSVHISSLKRGKLTPGRKLVPACQHRVEKDMVVTTRAGADGYNPAAKEKAELASIARFAKDVNSSVRVLAEFLAADHLRSDPTPVKRFENELAAVVRTLGVNEPRAIIAQQPSDDYSRNTKHASDPRSRRLSLPMAGTQTLPEELRDRNARRAWVEWNETIDEQFPYSSRTVVVDHDRCILCDRCARSCSDVKPFKIIGHTGKGYGTRISFDLDAVMGESGCVQCGECMVSCPTGALSLRRRVQPRSWPDSPTAIPQNPNTAFPVESGFLTADEMLDVWLYHVSPTSGPRVVFPFRSIPYSYLKWNEGSVRRWVVRDGERRVLCKEGEYGSTAFLLHGTGRFPIYTRSGEKDARPGFFARLFGRGGSSDSDLGHLLAVRPGNQLVLGEMACLTHQPRTATVVAEVDPAVPALELVSHESGWPTARVVSDVPPTAIVYEITRNLLDMMQRSASARDDLEEVYTTRAIEACVYRGELFSTLTQDQRHAVAQFLLKSGKLEFRRISPGETVVAEGEAAHDFYFIRLGTLRVFHTVAGREQVIGKRSANDHFGAVALLADELRRRNLIASTNAFRGRFATVAALDPVEIVRVPGAAFREMCERFPEVYETLIVECSRRVNKGEAGPAVLGEYVKQGLFQAQKLLVLDLLSCTRCDECTKACADSHDGHSRLLRDGLRFGDFLVATSCRSCHVPYCMEGCPVDAIHRRGNHLEVVIENHCIGCGLCEKNCPYGSIQMVPRIGSAPLPGSAPVIATPRRAANCDLCGGGEPFCVQACPHDAAHRMDGPALLAEVTERTNRVEVY